MEYNYTLICHIKIYNSDPICTIDLNEELLLFGTMLGYCGYFLITTEELKIVSEIEDEHIIAAQIYKDKLLFAVGDQKLIIVEKKNKYFKDSIIKVIENYPDEAEHYKKCENIYCMIKNEMLFSIELNIPKEDEKDIDIRLLNWTVKNYLKDKHFEDRISISNFWVPFDFDGDILIFTDFNEKTEKFLKIFSCKQKKLIFTLKLEDNKEADYLGHISHIKILKNDRIFLVHNYRFCQIRDLKFKLIQSFEHIGKEIIACDIYYKKENEFQIALLDLNCGIYIYEKGDRDEYLFNLNKLFSISREIKEQKFFALGYPYFIKINKKYIAISADQGCFLFKR